MKKLNVILVYNKEENKILMCKRKKEPYKGKFNLVGGKVEQGEDKLHAAYRELKEETGITENDIKLTNIMNFQYIMQNMELERDYSSRLFYMEEGNNLPYNDVWNYLLESHNIPGGKEALAALKKYEKDVQSLRK